MTAQHAYKLLTADDWARAQALGRADAAVDRADGFVHLSTAAQLAETARRHFAGCDKAVLLEYDTDDLGDALRWEPSRDGDLFPHVYGELRLAEACRRWTLGLGADGAPALPEDLQT